jgi:NAD-dependent DNA ligase
MVELLLVVFGVGALVGYVARDIQAREDDPDEIETFLDERETELRQRYETTEMDYVEFGERIAVLEDPDTERIMRDAVTVDRIGPKTALRIAQWFDGWADYRDADQDAYEAVNGIGPNKGRALARRH